MAVTEKYETLLLENRGGITVLTFNRPEKYNCVNKLMGDELLDALSHVVNDDETRVLVITGSGKAFCAGADVQDLGKKSTVIENRIWTQCANKMIMLMTELERPIIAKVNGVAVGVGCSIALNSDMVIASENAKFSLIFSQVGLIGDGGSLFNVPRLVGPMKAKELYFTARVVDAAEAERIGLINRVVAAQQLDEEVDKLAEQLASGPTVAYGIAKKIINKGLDMDLSSVLELEAMGQAVVSTTEDVEEAVNAFLQKRKPVFKGK